ncbi:MAG: hypothetical protein ACI845_001875 [Gammaproteobacteria bacterium]|jgi:hypothetical protein
MILLLFGLFFEIGRGYQDYGLQRLTQERDVFLNKVAELKTRNLNLVRKNAQLEEISNIERAAYQNANQTLIKLQQEMLAQKEELVFYQGIVSPKKSAFGVNLQSFSVKRKNGLDQFNYKLVLTKSGKSNQKVSGNISMLIRGETVDGISEINLASLKLENTGINTKFSFRYFQVFEEDITFPAGFTPLEVEIGINPSTKKVKSFTETISWSRTLSEAL